ncbi:DUF3592 domain-containing protein [Enterobacillus tribolii]|uniref:DUF3592 domain-containing protein n=1 Tax=Enterobacillus tribolii TaxID=1487935 RepID=A0A370Q6W1_9GAMM|nr:DUF3592 domain-containing protein [Enterobacillus tribolii]MBW7984900.1 DUF3592 domain-containing protein [Enterobacillus tribolii]RDK84112.1 hypothetical protein C8D90_11431 [Enterobacillus tribolii]
MAKIKSIITVIGFIIAAPFLGLVGFFKFITVDLWRIISQFLSPMKLTKDGISTSGQIVSVKQSDLWYGNQPVLEIEVKHITKDGRSHAAMIKEAVSLTELARFQPGQYIDIKYDPKNPRRAAINNNPLY